MSRVDFVDTNLEKIERNPQQIVKFLDAAGMFSSIKPGDFVGIKIHFGEDKDKGYIKPRYIKPVVEKIKRIGAKPFLFDTNTLYRGKRANSIDHFNLAFFTHKFGSLNVPVLIPDGLKSKVFMEADFQGKHFKKFKIIPMVKDLDFMLVFSHLTGHMLAGFGAAIKNLGMGCASRAGKMDQHCEVSPSVKNDICILCKKCVETCPEGAIYVKDEKIHIDGSKCIGCAQCISVCPKKAIKIVWSDNYGLIQERMAEYAAAVLKNTKKSFFVNFATFITKECDCMSKETEGVVPDIGLLASDDAVSIDKATLDLLNQKTGKEVFKQMYPDIDSNSQLNYAASLGAGSLEYELKNITV